MTAGTEVVCNDVVRKVEIEEKCVAGLNTSDLNEVGAADATIDCNVGGIGNVGGNRKEDADDSSYVFVSGGIEVTSGDPGDTGGVNVSAIAPKSESADEVDQFKKEELGIESKVIPVDPLVLETNGIIHASATVRDAEIKAIKDEVTLENGSTIDLPVVPETNENAQDVNGHLGKITGEEGLVVKSTDEVEGANGIMSVEAKTNIVSGVTFDPDPTLNPMESSQVTDFESEPTIKLSEESESQETITQSLSTPDLINTTDESLSTVNSVRNTDCQVMVNDGQESVSTLIDKAECQVTVDGSDKPPEDLECQVTAGGSESSGGPIKEPECQVKVDASGMPSDDLECQVTADRSEPSGIPIEELECQVTVDGDGKPSEDLVCQVIADGSESSGSQMKEREVSAAGSESIGSLVDNQECPVSVDGSESNGNHTEEVDSSTTVNGSDRNSEDSLIVTPEVDVEAEPNQVCSGIELEHQSESVSAPDSFEDKKTAGTVIGSGTESEENPGSGLVLSENPDAPANGQVENSDGILEMEEMSQTQADGVPLASNAKEEKSEEKLEKQGEGSSETLIKITESVELDVNSEVAKEQLKTEDEIQESEIVVTDNVQNDLNLEDDTIESTTEAETPLETETNIEPITHEITASQYEVSCCIDNTQEGIRPEVSAENVEKQGEGSSEEPTEITSSVELNVNFEETKEQVKTEDEIQEPQIVVTDNVQNDLDLEDHTSKSTTEAEVPLETETNIGPITHEITASQYEVSSCIDETQEGIQPEGSTENVETLASTDPVKSECKNSELLVEKENDSLSNPDDLTIVERKVEVVAHPVTENGSDEGMDCGTGIENVDDDEEKETEVTDEPVGDDSTSSFPDTNVNPVAVIEFGSIGRHETVHDMHDDDDVINVPDVVNGEMKPVCVAKSDNPERNVDGSQGDRNSDKMSCPEVEDMDGVLSDEIPTSSAEGSVTDALDVQNEEAEVLAYNFLIRIPRFEDEMFRDQIRSAQAQVDEKTRLRDAIRVEIQGKRARLKAHNEEFNAAKMEETAARRLVRLKRQEIDSVQSVINRVKNAMSVKDIDGRIYNMEHMIQHETLCLKDEKQFIREIKQLKTLRDQLASNMGSQDEVQQALDQKDQNDERMKTLRKELDSLKDKVSKAEAAAIAVGKKYDEESRRERELQAQFRAADDVRQKAYAHLNSLKKQTYDKNKNFRQYKDDVMTARDFASRGDKDSLHRLCANQVEAFMEQWNNNAEFRNEYISRCNMNASRRQRPLDGGSLGPDDVAPVLPSNVNERVDRSLVSIPVETKSVTLVSAVEQEKTVSSAEDKNAADNKSIENLSGQKNQTLKTKGVVKATLVSDTATVTEKDETLDNRKEEENTLTKEEMELARKAEELRKQEIAAKLKEQRRLEEKAKATEALERKKRNAEKAQIRAELRAKKEAEQKEKEREKRLRKKEKKKAGGGGGDGSINGEEVASSESSNEATTKEMEVVKESTKKKSGKAAAAAAHFFSKQLKPKPIPPPLANRNRKRWQQWGKVVLAAVAILALFLLGNTGLFLNLRVLKTHGGV